MSMAITITITRDFHGYSIIVTRILSYGHLVTFMKYKNEASKVSFITTLMRYVEDRKPCPKMPLADDYKTNDSNYKTQYR